MSPTQPGGHLAITKNKSVGKVLVLHAWWGLNKTIKNYCDQLAEEGFTVYAPDLYHGKLTDEIETAEIYSNELSLDQARIDMDEALNLLLGQTQPSEEGISVIGFSLGAFLALDLSITHPKQISKVVVYYGTGPDNYTKSTASYLGHFAEFDVFEPQTNVDELETALKKSNRPYSFYKYPDTGHWFCEPDRVDAYKEEAATLAWERTLSFLCQS
ncbi:MAG: dienelactone hydrolase family protein [Chloroflexi bacterium HGW-Chloroflexi-3]|nr:MAG: dienelactone hydrolase family protein [Chloroflexi bacterium HGW-Chloroflexi-3]